MTDLTFLAEYNVPIIMGICFCFGYILKNLVTTDKVNKYIPFIMGVTGVAINVWMNLSLTPEILLAGMASGLSSTGLYETFAQLKKKKV